MTEWQEEIRFLSKDGEKILDKNKKLKAIEVINKAIEKERTFLDSECLYGTLKDFQSDLNITIFNKKKHYYIDLGPKSGEGHDFSFNVLKTKEKIDRDTFSVGEVISEPDEVLD